MNSKYRIFSQFVMSVMILFSTATLIGHKNSIRTTTRGILLRKDNYSPKDKMKKKPPEIVVD
ncbi:MAG: hypothetical protein ACPKPY_01665 [Nitrososphaeraceae archaeon]